MTKAHGLASITVVRNNQLVKGIIMAGLNNLSGDTSPPRDGRRLSDFIIKALIGMAAICGLYGLSTGDWLGLYVGIGLLVLAALVFWMQENYKPLI